MSLLFHIEKKTAKPKTEALLISPFKEIWERDDSEEKENAIEDLTYVEFCSSVKSSNPYSGVPDHKKEEEVRKAIITRDDWEEDDLIKEAKAYNERMQREASPTYNYYISAKKAAEKMQTFFNNFDMEEVNPKTMNPLYKPGDITRALNDTSKVLKNLEDLRQKVDDEVFESTKERGGRKQSPLANPGTI